jgi:hypothetical protein
MNIIEAFKLAPKGSTIINSTSDIKFIKTTYEYGKEFLDFEKFMKCLTAKLMLSTDWEIKSKPRSYKLSNHQDVNLHFALQVLSGRIDLKQLQDEPAAEIFHNLSCELEAMAVAEDVIYQRLKCGVE